MIFSWHNRSWIILLEKKQDSKLIGYAHAGYLSDPRNARSQIGYVFLHGGTTIS
jgi:hypothetical protein